MEKKYFNLQKFTAEIQQHIERAGSARKLSKSWKISHASISRWAKGTEPDLESFLKFICVTGRNVDRFINRNQ